MKAVHEDAAFKYKYGSHLSGLAKEVGFDDLSRFVGDSLERYAAPCIEGMLSYGFVLWGRRYFRTTEWAEMDLQQPEHETHEMTVVVFSQGLPPRTAAVLDKLVREFPKIQRTDHLHRLILVAVYLYENLRK